MQLDLSALILGSVAGIATGWILHAWFTAKATNLLWSKLMANIRAYESRLYTMARMDMKGGGNDYDA